MFRNIFLNYSTEFFVAFGITNLRSYSSSSVISSIDSLIIHFIDFFMFFQSSI